MATSAEVKALADKAGITFDAARKRLNRRTSRNVSARTSKRTESGRQNVRDSVRKTVPKRVPDLSTVHAQPDVSESVLENVLGHDSILPGFSDALARLESLESALDEMRRTVQWLESLVPPDAGRPSRRVNGRSDALPAILPRRY